MENLTGFLFLLPDSCERTLWRTLTNWFDSKNQNIRSIFAYEAFILLVSTLLFGGSSSCKNQNNLTTFWNFKPFFLEAAPLFLWNPGCTVISVSAWRWYWKMLSWWFLGYTNHKPLCHSHIILDWFSPHLAFSEDMYLNSGRKLVCICWWG